MNKKLKYLLIGLGAILIIGQFIRPKQNISEGVSDDDITTQYEIPSNVEVILKKACMDCHSDNTVYPGYAEIFPVSWYLYNHVYGGKKKLDFSLFATYDKNQQVHKLEEIKEVMDEGRMPLSSYVNLHSEASLSGEEVSALKTWCDQLILQIRS